MRATPAVIVLGASGLETARRVAAALPGAGVHGLAGRVGGTDVTFAVVGEHLCALFQAGRPIVGVCAAGILIRGLAPVLGDKRREPPVVAVADDGSVAVPLLGGHHGANLLARRIAEALGGSAAITTAGDRRFGVALDDPPPGWRLANPDDAKPFAVALLAGAAVRLDGAAPWLEASRLRFAAEASLVITVTERRRRGSARRLVYHPAVLAVGVGCERGAEPAEVIGLVEETLRDAGLSEAAVAAVVSLDLKMDEPAVHETAATLGVPVRFFAAATLQAETPRLAHPSTRVFREVGCHGVAEGAALAAVGPLGELVVAKRILRRATCAIARAPGVIDVEAIGRARGSLVVVGIGPGDEAWRSPEATAAIVAASDVVGYGGYLDLVAPLATGKVLHRFALGEEELRVTHALDLAAAGGAVALVSSGDAGLYAMASLVFECIERHQRPDWARVAISICPGITALQAAAARAGAPLGHDFCAVSLSDLMTPWATIERRLRAAAEGDFVIALYNPASRRRRWQVARAKDILLGHRAADTPVVIARNLGRAGESLQVVALGELDGRAVDMLSVLLVGSSATRRLERRDGGYWVYTPRGYSAKAKRGDAA